jgi:radical SAM protein with 4Fe4S-binding SPASM domain
MRKNFYEFTERVSAVAFEMSLSTNGTLINSDNVGFIASHFDDVQVSLDCSDEQEFDRFRGLHGAFRKTTAGIRALRERDVTVVAQTVLTLSGLRAIEDLGVLLEQLGVSEWNIRLAFASGREVENKAIFPKHKMLLEVSDVFQKLRDRHGGAIRISGGINYENTYNEPYRYTKNASRLVTCSGGTILAALSANGSLAPCPLFSETDYCSDSVWEIGLAEAWRKATCMTEMRSTISDTISGCGTCANLNGKCGGGCRAKSYLAKGTIKSNDYHCNYSR